VKEKPTIGSPFFGAFPYDRIPKALKDVNYIFLVTVAIPVNYISEFQELYEITTYYF
jgi:hypothetical protein